MSISDGNDMAMAPASINFKNINLAEASGGSKLPNLKIRKDFPESWLLDIFDDVGLVEYLK